MGCQEVPKLGDLYVITDRTLSAWRRHYEKVPNKTCCKVNKDRLREVLDKLSALIYRINDLRQFVLSEYETLCPTPSEKVSAIFDGSSQEEDVL